MILRKKLWIRLGSACPLNILIQLAEALGLAEAIDSYYIPGWDWVNISFDRVNLNFSAPGFSVDLLLLFSDWRTMWAILLIPWPFLFLAQDP